jgi:glycosyltransferase involved in cell wall biosynthesis
MNSAVRVLELRSVRGTGGGPEKTILLGAALSDPAEFDISICYLRDARDNVFAIDEQARAVGVRYDEILERHSFDPAVWSKLRALVRQRRIQIVHAHEYKTDVLTWLLARAEGVTALATVHGWTGHSTRERRLYYPVDKWLLARFPRLIAVSTDIRDELIRAGAPPRTVTTVLNGIDARVFRRTPSEAPRARAALGIAPEEFVLGSIGRLEPQKRFDLLIEAFARIAEHEPKRPMTLLIAGEGSERAALEAAIERRRLHRRCRLLGHRTDVIALHHAFDLFVQSSDYEGTPNAVLEAMALETPVVATDAGGTAELVRREIDGLIVATGRVDALVDGLERALADPQARAARVARARERVETDLSFETRTRKVEQIYRELAAARPDAPDRTAA